MNKQDDTPIKREDNSSSRHEERNHTANQEYLFVFSFYSHIANIITSTTNTCTLTPPKQSYESHRLGDISNDVLQQRSRAPN
jgi:hypothetical protein